MPTFPKKSATAKPAGVIGLKPDQKETGKRVDFRPDDFVLAIETKGYRLAWSRATVCPCKPINDQTQQTDPNCSICKGAGWVLFRPEAGTIDEKLVGELTPLQKSILGDNATVIRGIMSGLTNGQNPWENIGPRLEGVASLTVRAENKLGYYDRIVNLDSLIPYSQLLKIDNPAAIVETKYPIVQVNHLRTLDQTYTVDTDFTINNDGNLVWVSGQEPAKDSLFSCHYLCHPTWRAMTYPHAIRLTPVKAKKSKPLTPGGDPVDLPVQAMLQLEFMIKT